MSTAEQEPGADAAPAQVEALTHLFVQHWGEMANAWGINRTMGQIHGLLYLTSDPLSAEAIMRRLGISRGNASMNLRALEDWGVIRRVHQRGDRREYYQAITDVIQLAHTLVRERKRRELDPTMRALRQFLTEADAAPESEELRVYRERVGSMLELLETIQAACDRFLPMDPHELPRLLREVDVEGLD